MCRSDATCVAQFVHSCTRATDEVEARRSLFLAVRDLPYGTDAASDAVALLQQGRGNCLAKADLLQRGFHLLGYQMRRVRWKYTLPPMPPEVELLPCQYDLHTAVEVRLHGQWVLVDATNDPLLKCGGLVVATWNGIDSTAPNYAPMSPIWREGIDESAIADALIEIEERFRNSPGGASEYLSAFNAWLHGLRIQGQSSVEKDTGD